MTQKIQRSTHSEHQDKMEYEHPKLRSYGSLRDLTSGGSLTQAEGIGGGNKKGPKP